MSSLTGVQFQVTPDVRVRSKDVKTFQKEGKSVTRYLIEVVAEGLCVPLWCSKDTFDKSPEAGPARYDIVQVKQANGYFADPVFHPAGSVTVVSAGRADAAASRLRTAA